MSFKLYGRLTYDIVTPESAEDGDFSEAGWVSASSGIDYPNLPRDEDPNLKEWQAGKDAALRLIGEGDSAAEAAREAFSWLKREGFDLEGTSREGSMSLNGETRSEAFHVADEESSPEALAILRAMEEKRHERKRKAYQADLWEGWPSVSWRTEEAGKLVQIQDFTLHSVRTLARLEEESA